MTPSLPALIPLSFSPPVMPTTDPRRQLQGKSYDCAKSIHFKLCVCAFGSVRVKKGRGWVWRVAFTGNKPLPQLSIFLSRLLDFSPWSFSAQHTRLHYLAVLVIWFFFFTNLTRIMVGKRKESAGFSTCKTTSFGYAWVRRSWTEWEISVTCRGGHFNLAQKILRYNPFTLHCFCCSARYYAPIPLSFHLPYSPPPLRLHHHHHHCTLKLQLSWSLSTDSQANTPG